MIVITEEFYIVVPYYSLVLSAVQSSTLMAFASLCENEKDNIVAKRRRQIKILIK
ncbi:hypothetical protein [Haloferax sp. Atlit-24N]|uniref:hypothetical protein n=1 Tax=Haloferax sp. Atlit-24N TaxID=2077200 RepID=UPI00131500CC|nr:hypothetical protein [Haloferax sp. Atlit-24N]